MAEFRGERAFSALVLGGSGGKAARMNIQSPQCESTSGGEVEGASLTWFGPGVPACSSVLLALRAVRAEYLRKRMALLDPGQDRVLHGFDAVVVPTGRAPGAPAPLVVRQWKVPPEQG